MLPSGSSLSLYGTRLAVKPHHNLGLSQTTDHTRRWYVDLLDLHFMGSISVSLGSSPVSQAGAQTASLTINISIGGTHNGWQLFGANHSLVLGNNTSTSVTLPSRGGGLVARWLVIVAEADTFTWLKSISLSVQGIACQLALLGFVWRWRTVVLLQYSILSNVEDRKIFFNR